MSKFWQSKDKGRASERNKRVNVIRITRERVSGGYAPAVETPAGPYWASVEPLTEHQRVKFQSVSVDASHRVTVDGAVEVAEGDNIEFEGRRFLVKTVRREDETRRDKIIITQEIRPGQKE